MTVRITRTIRVGAATPAEQAANPDSTNPGSMSDVVARAVARHRADMEKTVGQAVTEGPATISGPAKAPQNQNQSQNQSQNQGSAMNENKDVAQSQNRPSWWGEKTAEAARRKQAAPDKPAAQATQKKAASAAHQAAEAARKFKGKSL